MLPNLNFSGKIEAEAAEMKSIAQTDLMVNIFFRTDKQSKNLSFIPDRDIRQRVLILGRQYVYKFNCLESTFLTNQVCKFNEH